MPVPSLVESRRPGEESVNVIREIDKRGNLAAKPAQRHEEHPDATGNAIAPPRRSTLAVPAHTWRRGFARRIRITDHIIIIAAVAIAQLARFGTTDHALLSTSGVTLRYTGLSIVIALAWLAALKLENTRDVRIIGAGALEYQRIIHASVKVFGIIAIVAFLLDLGIARGYLAIALPVGVVGIVASRWSWRRWLVTKIRRGRFITNVVVLGSGRGAEDMIRSIRRDHAHRIVGVCVPQDHHALSPSDSLEVDGIAVPVIGDEHSVLAAVRRANADVVAVTATERLGADILRELAWELEAEKTDLVVHPGVTDVSEPRLKIRPTGGMPLLHVEAPQYQGAHRLGKALVDRLGALLALAVFGPFMVLIALGIKYQDRGPVLYRQTRVGTDGVEFSMIKFRSMVVGADAQQPRIADGNDADGPLFKMRDDPRITPIGRYLRKYSLDELPQLFNVLRGEMSLVGPRPPLPSEVASYTRRINRRMLVRPGMTGPWQVSGRSDLTWEETVRLDLSYVENWTFMQDLIILWRTARVVVKGEGAY
ncbi:sugar transferase [Lolliginicoccus suaedae]|uniref:sugar transferase n=1 Tax=Lolliginicoccus suaedae TaxID=2605429 RepID=UPI0011EFC748|nr:sugar transferase [Lolliginicoccus suaedae]